MKESERIEAGTKKFQELTSKIPKKKKKGRGDILRIRTIKPKGHPEKYMRIAVFEKAGVRGGRTVAKEEPKKVKKG